MRGTCHTLELAALTLDRGFGVQAELRTDSSAADGLGRNDTSTAELCGCNQQSHDGKSESRTSWIDTLS